jgi:general secretion pathway protein J
MKKFSAFTLIEVIIALAIFALISMITAQALRQILHTEDAIAKKTKILHELELTQAYLNHDTRNFIISAVTGNEMQIFASFIGKPYYMEFTRTGVDNPGNKNQNSKLRRIAYLCKNHNLVRRAWPILNVDLRKNFRDLILLSDLKTCRFKYLTSKKELLTAWHRSNITNHKNNKNSNADDTPIALQIILSLPQFGDIEPIFMFPQGYSYETKI